MLMGGSLFLSIHKISMGSEPVGATVIFWSAEPNRRTDSNWVLCCFIRPTNLFKLIIKIIMKWTPEAEDLFKEIPFFVRFAARGKIEKFARDRNEEVITVEIYKAAKQQFNKRKP